MDFKRVQELVAQHGTPVLFLSESRLKESYRTSKPHFRCFSYYAVKPMLPEIISILDSEGSCFDVCSNGEIDVLRDAELRPTAVSIPIP